MPVPGLVVVDKPAGLTSHAVVSRVRRLVGTRKVGHAGTLDPMATGVLVLGVDRATRLLGHLMLTEKGYTATVRLGVATTTDDAEGEVTDAAGAGGLDEAAARAALEAQQGELLQVPTAVSAIKVDGKRAYQRVRDGEDVELKARPVTVHELTTGPAVRTRAEDGTEVLDVDVALRCSSGTYVRAIARDAGRALGVGGHLTALRRTAVGPYDLASARTLEELTAAAEEGGPSAVVLPIAEAARAAFPGRDLDEDSAASVRVGRRLPLELGGLTAVFAPDGQFLALYEPSGEPGTARAAAVFV
ncbi:tRNA pseudouridine(55) synthase TruB [Nocardioides sp. GY 10127]|uniref:tRNA pseudouridine(55) synthase TruB n=1 Tax=Nocardioides sp. GY 10127 TaxID=2569762 RepID=UPI0010A870DE|nr:tRNA pseudouridine(55) synthase TruB [Nocardioides sp. GY 10127]TIC81109.1 tRNA pseudouridine(55) synthase TruB [Nocardioides sp. GY 10127]